MYGYSIPPNLPDMEAKPEPVFLWERIICTYLEDTVLFVPILIDALDLYLI